MRAVALILLAATAACAEPAATPRTDAVTQDQPSDLSPPPTLFPVLTTSEFLPGEAFDIVVSGMPRWTRTYLFASLVGASEDAGPCAPYGGGCVDLAPQVYFLGFGLADAAGQVTFNTGPPPETAIEATFQAGAFHPNLRLAGQSSTVHVLLQDADLDGVATPDDCDDDDPSTYAWVTGYLDDDQDGVAADDVPIALCTDGSLPTGYTDTPAHDCDDGDPLIFPGGVEVCDGVHDDNCDGNVDEGCPSEDPFHTGSCTGTPWSAGDAMAHLAGRSRVVLASATIQQRSCPGLVCGGPASDWVVRYLTYSGGSSTRYRNMTATMDLVLFNDGGVPAMSIQHTSFGLGNYPDDDGMVYGFPPALISYPHVRAFNDTATGSDYIDLDDQVKGTGITYGDGCVRWTAEPFGASLTHDWAVRFTW